MEFLSHLTKAEKDALHIAPALVTILVGAADGKLDGEERNWSERLLRARSYAGNEALQDFYREVAEGFWVDLQHEMSVLPNEADQRNELIANRLEGLNNIFPKLELAVAYGLYKGLLGLAEEVAKASGGFLRIGAIAAAEHPWVKLPMLSPISAPHVLEKEVNDFDTNIWGERTDN